MDGKTIARQCTLCEAHCGILVTVEGEQVTRIEGNPDDVLSKGYICNPAFITATKAIEEFWSDDQLTRDVYRKGRQI
ncbi:hypothetical protein, partial [Gordonia aichiensis]